MAEGFANYYGRGWLTALSVGSHPAGFLMPNTIKVMQEKGIDISSQSSKGLAAVDLERTDWIVIMESSLAGVIDPLSPRTELLHWFLPDPVGESIEFYREVRDQIEMKVLDFLEKNTRAAESHTNFRDDVLDRILFPVAKRFVAGRTIQEAVRVVQGLNEQGISATLDVLGENVQDKGSAQAAADRYLTTLDWIEKAGIQSNVSLKLTQMGLEINREFCHSNLVRICERAARTGNFVRIDMEGSRHTEATLSLFFDLYREYKNVGIVIQAYLRRSACDLQRINNAGARVRLCKGAYKEPPAIAYQKMPEIRENFKKLVEVLFTKGDYPAIATHDDQLIDWTKQHVRQNQISPAQFELQMLYGVRPETQRALARQGYRMRVYVPYGTHWLPYFSRRLRERKENVYFVLRNLFKG